MSLPPNASETSVIQAILSGIGAPSTQVNIDTMAGWIALEQGGKWPPSAGKFNPMNTTQNEPGATSFNSVNVRNYTGYDEGVAATVTTLNNGRYGNIIASLKAGTGVNGPGTSGELLAWSGNGYSSVPSRTPAGGGVSGTPSPVASSTSPGGLGGLGGIFSLPSEITGFFQTADKFVTAVMWLTKPSNWIRIVAFLAGMALLLFSIHAFIAVGNGEPIVKAPNVIPVPL